MKKVTIYFKSVSFSALLVAAVTFCPPMGDAIEAAVVAAWPAGGPISLVDHVQEAL